MSKKSANILDDFTKDPNYSNRIKSAGGPLPEPQADTGNFFTREDNRSFTPAGGLSRRWDNRFATERIPHYDAINDKFCKFSLKKKLLQQPARKATAPASVGPRPMVGAFSSSGSVGSANNRPHHLNPINNGRGSPLPPLRVGDTQQDAESITSAFSKSRNRLISLWDELGTPEEERAGLQSYITASNPSMDDVRAITEEIQRLVDVRSAAVEAEKAIELREGFLYLLQELAERFDHQGPATAAEKATTFKELSALVTPFRNASLQAVEAIVCWGDLQREPSLQGVGVRPPYLWKGVSYLHKMSGDTFFLARSRLGGLIGFELKANPLMDPRREVRNADGTPSGKAKNQPNVYIPYARLTKAESHLLEEAQRQAALKDIPGLTSTAEALGIQQRIRDDDETNEAMLEEEQDWVRKQGVIRSRGSILGEQHRAATDIQRVYRSHLARRYAGALREQKEAAITIQMAVRKHLASVHVQRRRKEAEAAKKIQALHRGTFTRSRIHQIRASHEAATTVQRVYRGHLARKYTDMLWYLHQCARKIQATFRGFRARKLVNGEVATVRHMAAALIQSRWRGHAVRSNAKYNPEKSEKVVRLQAWFRGIIDRAFVRELIIAKRAATMIQTQYRITLAKRQTQQLRREREDNAWETYLGVANTAATRIQCGWRMHAAKGRVDALRDHRKVDMDRRSIEQTLEEKLAIQDLHAKKHHSAVAIQAQMRGCLARRNYQMIRHLIFCATQIQKVVRGHLSRQHSKSQRSVLMHHMEEQLSAVGLRDTIPSIVEQAKSAIYAADESVGSQAPAATEEDVQEKEDPDFEPLSKNVSATDAFQAEGVSVATIDANNDITLISPTEPSLSPNEPPFHSNDDNDTTTASTEPTQDDDSNVVREKEDSRVDDTVDVPHGDPEWSVTQENVVHVQLPSSPPPAADLQVLEDAAALIQRNVRGYQSRGNGTSNNKQSRVARQKASSDSHAQCSEYAATVLQRNLAPRSKYLSKSRSHRIATKQASRLATGQEREAAAMMMGRLVPVAKARSEADMRRNRREAASVAAKRDATNAERQYAANTIANGLMPLVPIKEASRLVATRNAQSATSAQAQETDYAREIMGRFLTAVAAKQRSSLARGEKASEFFEAQVGEQMYAARMIQCALRVRQAKGDVSIKRQQASDAKAATALLDMAQSVRDTVEESEDAEYKLLIVRETSEGLAASALHGALATSLRTNESSEKSAPTTPAKAPTAPTTTSTPPTSPVVVPTAVTPAHPLPVADSVSPPQETVVDTTPTHTTIPIMTTTPQTPESPATTHAEEPTTISPTKSVDEELREEVTVVEDAPLADVDPVDDASMVATTPKEVSKAASPVASLPVIDSSDSDSDMEVDVRPPTAPAMDAIRPYKEAGTPTPEETATQVQAILRCWHSALIVDYWAEKKIQGAHHAKETNASTTIQSCFRSHKARGEVEALRNKKAADDKVAQEKQLITDYDTAVEILRTEENELRRAQVEAANQEAAAFVNAERKEQAKTANETSAAITIQCAWRCYNARFMKRWMHSVRDEKRANAAAVERSELEVAAAHKIQCATRQRQARDRTSALREDKAAKRKELMDREAKLHGSATSIQCMVRQRNARDKLHFLQDQKQSNEKNEAAKKAAEQARRLQELKDIESNKVRTVEEHAAAIKIQCAYRSYNARFEKKWRADNKARGGDGTRPSTTSSRISENSAVAKVHASRLDELRAAELRAQTEDGPNPYAAVSHDEEL